MSEVTGAPTSKASDQTANRELSKKNEGDIPVEPVPVNQNLDVSAENTENGGTITQIVPTSAGKTTDGVTPDSDGETRSAGSNTANGGTETQVVNALPADIIPNGTAKNSGIEAIEKNGQAAAKDDQRNKTVEPHVPRSGSSERNRGFYILFLSMLIYFILLFYFISLEWTGWRSKRGTKGGKNRRNERAQP